MLINNEIVTELYNDIMQGKYKIDKLKNHYINFEREVQANYFAKYREFIATNTCSVIINDTQNNKNINYINDFLKEYDYE